MGGTIFIMKAYTVKKGGDSMCRRTKLWGMLLCAVALGLILSCFFGSWFVRFLIGIVLLAFGMIYCCQ